MGIILLVIVFVIYSLTLTRQPTGDDLQKMISIENTLGEFPAQYPFDASPDISIGESPSFRYYLQVPLAVNVYQLFLKMKLGYRAVESVQVMHLVAGTIGILAFYYAVTQFAPAFASFIFSFGLALSFGWWYYSTHADYTLLSPVFQCILLIPLIRISTSEEPGQITRMAIALGITSAFVVLSFISSVVLIPVILLAVLLLHQKVFGKGIRFNNSGFIYLISFVLMATVLVFVVWQITYASHSFLDSVITTSTVSSGSSDFYYGVVISDIPTAAFGIAKSLMTYPFLRGVAPSDYFEQATSFGRASFLAWNGVLAIIFFAPLLYTVVLRKRMGALGIPALILVGWIVIQTPFGILWVPSEIKWWVSSLVAWYALNAMIYVSLPIDFVARRLFIFFFVLFAASLFLINFSSEFLPKSRSTPDPPRIIAQELSELSNEVDLFITSNNDRLDFYLPYFEERRVLAYPLALFSRGGDVTLLESEMETLIQHVHGKNGKVYFFDCYDEEILDAIANRIPSVMAVEEVSLPGDWTFGGKLCVLSES